MATELNYVQFVCDQLGDVGAVRYRKMFGEYLVYVDEKPVLSVCDNTVYVKRLPELADIMDGAEVGAPYPGAKEHYVLDVDNAAFARAVVERLVAATPAPPPKNRR